ncbi:MAG: oligosaccharide flippase family protein [Candidatus Cloacimonetes bacterium]|nr:oligosaccharide flippase family protein [Candidatus Cloacimonadota bacterium]
MAQFILLPLYTRYLTPSDYGILSSVQVMNSVLVLLYTLALNRAIFRLYFDFKTEKEKRDYLGTIFIGISISAVVITSIIFSLSDIIGSIYKSIDFYPYMSLSILASAITTFFLVPKTAYFVKEKANIFVLLSIIEFFTRNIFILVFVVFLEKGVLGYLQGQLAGNLLLLILFLFLTWKQVNFRFVKSFFVKSLRFSLPLLPMTLSAWVMNWSDRIFIERNFDTHDVGIYSLGYKIAMIIAIFSDSFYKAYNPHYFKTASNKPKEIALKSLKKTNTLYLLVVILFCSLIVLFAKEGISLLFDFRYYEAYKIVGIVGLAYVFGKAIGIFNLAIYQSKKTIFVMTASIIGAFVNIGLNFLLIHKYGAYGAAWATVITYFAMMFFTYYYARKCFYASFNKPIVYLAFVMMLLLNVGFYIINMNLINSIVLKIIIVLGISIFIWFRYKKELKIILKKV